MLDPQTPGSPSAVAAGCKCGPAENGDGKGCGWISDLEDALYLVDPLCPLHSVLARYQQTQDPELREVQGVLTALEAAGLVEGAGWRVGKSE